jgi:hypothetical protein
MAPVLEIVSPVAPAAPHRYNATMKARPLWAVGIAVVAVACGATQGGTVSPDKPVATTENTDASVTPAAECPEDMALREGTCAYDAEGNPPGAPGQMRPVPEGSLGEGSDARLVHSFWLDARRVRVSDYRACVQAGVCQPPAGREEDCAWSQRAEVQPMTCTSFEQSEAYCRWVGKRIMTDDEWERAAKKYVVYGIEEAEGQDSTEWTSSHHCEERIGGCGHARVTRGGNKAEERGRMLGVVGQPWVGFRCAWSERPPAVGKKPPPQVPLVPTTPGQIACDTTTCQLGREACCLASMDGVGYCIPGEERSECRGADVRAQCDENADCPASEVCCPYWGCSGGCPPEQVCQKAPCDYGPEICRIGGLCRTGFTCVPDWTGRHGTCQWQDVGAQCGGKRCSGATPLCCWDEAARKGTCAASACESRDLGHFSCTGPKDCGGSLCASQSTMGNPDALETAYGCVSLSHLVNGVLCHTKQDCPRHPPTGAEVIACRHTPGLPPGVKACVYFEEGQD